MRRNAFLFACLATAPSLWAVTSLDSPAAWRAALSKQDLVPGESAEIEVEATIHPGWHVYSMTQPAGGPIPTRVLLTKGGPIRPAGAIRQGPFQTRYDPVFGIDVQSFSDQARFFIPVRVIADAHTGSFQAQVEVFYQACDGSKCLRPKKELLTAAYTVVKPGTRISDARGQKAAVAENGPAGKALATRGDISDQQRCPDAAGTTVRHFYETVRGQQSENRDEYGRLLRCVPSWLEARASLQEKPTGEELYYEGLLWLRLDIHLQMDDHAAKAADALGGYLKTAGPHRFHESALANRAHALSTLKSFEEAIPLYNDLLKTYRWRSTTHEHWTDVTNVEHAGGRLVLQLAAAGRYPELEMVARSHAGYLKDRQNSNVFRLAHAQSFVLEALEAQGKDDAFTAAKAEMSKELPSVEKLLATTEMNLASRRAQKLEKKDPKAALAILKAARSDYQKAGFERTYEGWHRRLALVGSPAPPLHGDTWVNSAPLYLEELRGKVVLLDFWASWCIPCRRGFPKLEELNAHRTKDGLVVIGVTQSDGWVITADHKTLGRGDEGKLSWDRELELLKDFIKESKLTIPIAIGRRPVDPKEPFAEAPMNRNYGVQVLPTVVVIDREGTVRFVGEPEDEGYLPTLERALEGAGRGIPSDPHHDPGGGI